MCETIIPYCQLLRSWRCPRLYIYFESHVYLQALRVAAESVCQQLPW